MTRHKWMVAIALLISVVAWLAWTLSVAESDIAPQGHLTTPERQLV